MQGEQRDEVPTPRQRAFQTALFVMLTMMLLDPPADPSRRGVGEAEAAGGLGRREKVAAAAVDEALRSAGSSGARGEALRNVSGLYRGTYASTANGTAPTSGAAMLCRSSDSVLKPKSVVLVLRPRHAAWTYKRARRQSPTRDATRPSSAAPPCQ